MNDPHAPQPASEPPPQPASEPPPQPPQTPTAMPLAVGFQGARDDAYDDDEADTRASAASMLDEDDVLDDESADLLALDETSDRYVGLAGTDDDEELRMLRIAAAGVPLVTETSDAVNASDVDEIDPLEADPAYFAPTDPVFVPNEQGNIEIAAGFAPTALDDHPSPELSTDGTIGDEALQDAVVQALREDASTNALGVRVTVYNGVVSLTGSVPTLDDVQNAEQVANDVPGVRAVNEQLDILPA